ncbi:hypothetical protein [Acidithiobacillus sp.]|uniref:hypothetical protein n=1 Tax=Acidithiobacillus sp. TaxID=1872118 RepID=UPI0025C1FDF7|nr:hypothetical protein [Acidithiobacillus sp.]
MKRPVPLLTMLAAALWLPVSASAQATVPASSAPSAAIPPLLADAVQRAMDTPYHFHLVVRSSMLPISAESTGAMDLEEKASSVEARLHPLPGVTLEAQSITLGDRVWYRTTPPGGPFREEAAAIRIPKAIPWQDLEPYLGALQTLPARPIDGQTCIGYAFTLSPAGVASLSRHAEGLQLGTIQEASGDLWVAEAAPHYLCAAHLLETAVQAGIPYQLTESIVYSRWGEALHIVPPSS